MPVSGAVVVVSNVFGVLNGVLPEIKLVVGVVYGTGVVTGVLVSMGADEVVESDCPGVRSGVLPLIGDVDGAELDPVTGLTSRLVEAVDKDAHSEGVAVTVTVEAVIDGVTNTVVVETTQEELELGAVGNAVDDVELTE